jgi:geranylgeranyl reductase family protein
MYDVIVVGAGPAGSSVAKEAAEANLDVLLLDRELEIGIPDKCGEFLPSLGEMERLARDVTKLDDLFDPPNYCIVNRTKYVRFIFPNEVVINVDFDGVVVERKLFDKHLANEAARAGADISPSTKVIDIVGNGTGVKAKTLNGPKEIKSKTVIAADGAYSLIARKAGLPVTKNPLDYAIGYQYEMVGVEHDSDYVDMYIGENIAPGTYAWIIPKGDDVANVGTGVRVPFMKAGLRIRDYLRNFVEKNPNSYEKLLNAKPMAIKAGLIPVSGPLQNTTTNNIIAVGDAGGHTIPTIGGGIPTGLICGRIAGKAIAAHIFEGEPIKKFEETWKKEIGETLENSLRIRRMSDVIFNNYKMIDWFTKQGWLNKEMVEKFILCEMDTKMKIIEKTLRMVNQR